MEGFTKIIKLTFSSGFSGFESFCLFVMCAITVFAIFYRLKRYSKPSKNESSGDSWTQKDWKHNISSRETFMALILSLTTTILISILLNLLPSNITGEADVANAQDAFISLLNEYINTNTHTETVEQVIKEDYNVCIPNKRTFEVAPIQLQSKVDKDSPSNLTLQIQKEKNKVERTTTITIDSNLYASRSANEKQLIDLLEAYQKDSKEFEALVKRLVNPTGSTHDADNDFLKSCVKSIYKYFSPSIWLATFLLFIAIVHQPAFEDYFPRKKDTEESGIHAKLNYQVIVDRQARKLSVLQIFIILSSIFFIFILFRFASDIDQVIHTKDVLAYDAWISSIEKHLQNDTDYVEENTKIFWTVYFVRFILVRTLIAFVFGALLSFLVKNYRITDQARELVIQKEEALSALHYLARGEHKYMYDKKGKLLMGVRNRHGGYKAIFPEAMFFEGLEKMTTGRDTQIEEIVDLSRVKILGTDYEISSIEPALLPQFRNNLTEEISTLELISRIPIDRLFDVSSRDKHNNKTSRASEEQVRSLITGLKDLSLIKAANR